MRNSTRVVLLALLITAVGSCGRAHSRPLNITIWHTELDDSAKQVVVDVAREVEAEFRSKSPGIVPVLTVSALDWGELATRLFQNKSNPPDVTHLEPFMTRQVMATFPGGDTFGLVPLDSLIADIARRDGPPDPSIAALQRFRGTRGDSATFGIAHAIGTTFIAYRADWNSTHVPQPKTWEGLIPFADALVSHAPASPRGPRPAAFILPGKSPFFVEQLLNEMVVSMGGSLWRDGEPNFDSPVVARALSVLQDMIARSNEQFSSTAYRQQFDLFAAGSGAVVPVTYGRATKQIDAAIAKENLSEAGAAQRRLNFAVMPQPGRDSTTPGVATIDAEPWVIIARPAGDADRELRIEIGRAFLTRFYERSHYLKFATRVPVHLRPAFVGLDSEYDAFGPQATWSHWVSVGRQELQESGRTAPILMDRGNSHSSQPRLALSIQRKGILSDMVAEAAPPAVIAAIRARLSGQQTPSERALRSRAIASAMSRAQERATQADPSNN
jgi:ABC-type glycerol-3-phosphate transport system substrate-binding protein